MYSNSNLLCSARTQDNAKKKTFTYTEKSEEKRNEYIAKIAKIPVGKRVYVDESGVNTYFQREYGRALRGEKVEDTKRGRKFQRINIIGALCNGMHLAIKCYKQATNSEFFEWWFVECLLKEIPKGYTVIMDNASFHRKSKLYELSEKAEVGLIFLPPYSPDFNSIEKSWANMKRWLRTNMSCYPSIESAICAYFFIPDY